MRSSWGIFMNNKLITLIPIASSILLGAAHGGPTGPTITMEDRLSYAIISPGLKGYVTNISFAVTFKNRKSTNYVKIYKYKPLTKEYLLIKTFDTSNTVILSETFDVVEPYTKKEYQDCGLAGPRFVFEVQFSTWKFERYFDTSYRDYETTETIITNKVRDKEFFGSSSVYYYDGFNDYSKTINETFKLTDYAKEAFYEFNSQNYIDINQAIFTNHITNEDETTFSAQLTYSNAYFELYDAHNYFPYLHYSENDPRVIVLGELVNYSGGLGFSVKDNLYIDPLTRITYRTNKVGRIKTSKLFLPVGVKRKESEVEEANRFSIYAERVGYSKSKLRFDFDMSDFAPGLIGECATSDYCVQFESTEPDFEIGEETTYD